MSLNCASLRHLLVLVFLAAASSVVVCALTRNRAVVNGRTKYVSGLVVLGKPFPGAAGRRSPILFMQEPLLVEADDNDAAITDTNLCPLLRPVESCNVDRMSGTDLAYVGDVVFELFVRCRTVWPPKRTADLQQQAVAFVRGTRARWGSKRKSPIPRSAHHSFRV